MNRLLLNMVKRQKRELAPLIAGATVLREKTAYIQSQLSSPLVKIILGPRRAGKSTIALQALENENFAYVNLEDETVPKIEDGDELLAALDDVYGAVDYYFFDEIQNLSRWQQFLNRMLRLNKNIIVTGSNAQLLSEELSTALTGRHIAIEVLPFSFYEISSKVDALYAFDTYLISGGFPEVATGKVGYEPYLKALWDAVILKDIAKRKRVRNITALSSVLDLLLTSATSQFNVDGIRETLSNEVSSPTIKKFIQYGSEAYLTSELRLYSQKSRTRIKSNRKIYTVDNGFFSAKNIAHSKNSGTLLENAVFNELRSRGYMPNSSLFYYKSRSGYEVDFLIREGHKNKEAIQVSYSLSALKTRERELRALKETAEELAVERLTVITMTEESTEHIADKDIEIIPALHWFQER